jgi:hypothetical protein
MQVVMGLLIAIGSMFQSPAGEADEILAQLSKIRLDKKQIYNVRDITLRRDVLTIALNRGTIAFFEPVKGKVTGAVFIGNGEIVAISPDAIERQQIYRFTGTAVLNERFQTAVLRFTDGTYEEIKREISEHAQEDVASEDVAQFEPWDSILARRSPALNLRLLGDFLDVSAKPLFFAELNGEKTGWFDAVFDQRAAEEVSIYQLRQSGAVAVADVWASFNQRSEARNPEAVAHESKSPIEVLSYDIEGSLENTNAVNATASMRVRGRTDGVRVLNFELGSGLSVGSIKTEKDEPLPYYQYPDANGFAVLLPQALKPNQEFMLRVSYAGPLTTQGSNYPSVRQQTLPTIKSNFALPPEASVLQFEYSGHKVVAASYHDQWLIEGLNRYLALMAVEANDSGAVSRKALTDIREELRGVEGTGPIWLGPRLVSTISPGAYPAVYGKAVWVIHMLRRLMKQDGQNPDANFLAMLREFVETFDGKAVSTWDFEHAAEKVAKKPLDWFFDQWVFATGLPTYSVDYRVDASGKDFTIEGTLSQTGVPDGFAMPVPLYADGEYLGVVQVGESDGKFKFRTSQKPEQVRIDPEMNVLTAVVP